MKSENSGSIGKLPEGSEPTKNFITLRFIKWTKQMALGTKLIFQSLLLKTAKTSYIRS